MELFALKKDLALAREETEDAASQHRTAEAENAFVLRMFFPTAPTVDALAAVDRASRLLFSPESLPLEEKVFPRQDFWSVAVAVLTHPQNRVDVVGVHDVLSDDEAIAFSGLLRHRYAARRLGVLDLSQNMISLVGAKAILGSVMECCIVRPFFLRLGGELRQGADDLQWLTMVDSAKALGIHVTM